MANDSNLSENIMQKTLMCQPMFNGILWEIFKRQHRKDGHPQREKSICWIHVIKGCRKWFFAFWIYLLVYSQYIYKNVWICSVFYAQILRAVAANTVGRQGCSLYKIRTLGHSPGSDFFRFLIKLIIEGVWTWGLTSLLLFVERADSLLYSL